MPTAKQKVRKRMKFDRKAMAADLGKRAKKSYSTRDDKGVFKNFFNKEKMEGISTWYAQKGEHIIDIVPYYAGTNDPQVAEGKATYVLDVWAHMNVGPGGDAIICPQQYGERCPICEEKKRRSDNDEDYDSRIKPLRAKRRVVYNIIVRDGAKEEAKGVQVWEISHYFMEADLIKIAKDPDGGMIPFWCPTNGKRLSFERTGSGASNTSYSGHALHDRKKKVTDEHLASAYCLDDLIERPSFEAIYEMFYGKPYDASEDEAPEVEQNVETEKELSCPLDGVTFGEDFNQYEECDTCKIRSDCENASKDDVGMGDDVPY